MTDNLLCMFGLGVQFHDCYSQLCTIIGREPDFLCDNSSEKWGKEFFGKVCLSPSELCKADGNVKVIITVRKYEAIYRQLKEMQINDIYAACFNRCYDYVSGIKTLDDEKLIGNSVVSKIDVIGKWTFITGASRGIGRQIAIEMAHLDSNLILHSRNISHTAEVANVCTALGVQVMQIGAEFGDEAQLESMLDKLTNNFPEIDIVFNNAGISLPNGGDPWNISYESYMKHYAVNTVAPIRICCRLIPGMIKRGFGRVINITSTIQKRPGEAAYSCSKEAFNKFVHDITPGLRGTGVMVSLVCPGHVQSDMGGDVAPHPVESVVPGVLLGALTNCDVNGRWFIAQDYAGLSLSEAIQRDSFYYGAREEIL